MDATLEIVMSLHSAAVAALAEHLDFRNDAQALALLDDVLLFEVDMVTVLNERLRKYFYAAPRNKVHSAPASIER